MTRRYESDGTLYVGFNKNLAEGAPVVALIAVDEDIEAWAVDAEDPRMGCMQLQEMYFSHRGILPPIMVSVPNHVLQPKLSSEDFAAILSQSLEYDDDEAEDMLKVRKE